MTTLRLALADLRQNDVIQRLVAAAGQGDGDAFVEAADQLDWAGGWERAFRALAPLGNVPEAIQTVFEIMWHCSESQYFGVKHTLTTDLIGHDHLLADGLKLLLPPSMPHPMPATIYRGQGTVDHLLGRRGCWWTGDRDYAEWFATSRIRAHVGARALLATEAPAEAVIYAANDTEIIVDPRRLGIVRMIEPRGLYPSEDKIAA